MADPDDSLLRAELIDEITEAVVKPADARVRAKVITELVHEVDEAVKWRHQRNPDGQEERSLVTLVDAAAAHQDRMDTLGDDTAAEKADEGGEPSRRGEAPRNGSTAI